MQNVEDEIRNKGGERNKEGGMEKERDIELGGARKYRKKYKNMREIFIVKEEGRE